MISKVCTVTICILITFSGRAQDSTHINLSRKAIIFSTSLTYKPDSETINGVDVSDKFEYHEFTWATSALIKLSKYYRVGLDFKKIFTRARLGGNHDYFLLGLPNQLTFLHQPKFFLYATAGPYIGNYCTCGEDNPYKVKNLWYLNYGGGFNLRINEKFRANLGFTNANILTKTPGRYNFTQYLIALEYQLFMKEKKLEIRN